MINVDWKESVSGCVVYLCDLDASRDNIGSPLKSKRFSFRCTNRVQRVTVADSAIRTGQNWPQIRPIEKP